MATNDIRFNQVGGGCGTIGGLYTAYAPKQKQTDLEGKDFIGDWKNSIADSSWVFIYAGEVESLIFNTDADGLYYVTKGQLKRMTAAPTPGAPPVEPVDE